MRVTIVVVVLILGALSTAVVLGQQSSDVPRIQGNEPVETALGHLVETRITGQVFEDLNDLYRAAATAYAIPSQYQAFKAMNAEEVVIYRDSNTKKLIARSFKELGDIEKELVQKHKAEMERSMTAIRSNKGTESEQSDARRIVIEELDVQFEIDLDARKEQLKQVEKQLSELKEQLDKRQEAKSKLVDLRMKLLENEAIGLGFPSTWNSRKSIPGLGQPSPLQFNGIKPRPLSTSGFDSPIK